MKGELRLRILEFIKNAACSAEDIFFLFSLPHGTSLSRMSHLLDKRRSSSFRSEPQTKLKPQIKRNFNDFIYRLRKDNLISEVQKNEGYFFQLTQKGKDIIESLSSKNLPSSKYAAAKEDTWKIIIFDIPEKEKRKRVWLRGALKNLKFKMIQKSVWVGKVKLPREFIQDLKRINIVSFVEIFSITKTGSLRQISDAA